MKSTAAVALKRSAEREGLHLAIQRLEKAKHAAKSLDATISDAEDKKFAANRRVEAAEKAKAEAAVATARHLLDEAVGAAGARPPTAREARAALLEAQDDAETLKALVVGLRELTGERAQAVKRAEHLLEEAIQTVVRSDPGVGAMLARINELHRELQTRRVAIEFLSLKGMLPSKPEHYQSQKLDGSLEEPWRRAIEALASDADAPLP